MNNALAPLALLLSLATATRGDAVVTRDRLAAALKRARISTDAFIARLREEAPIFAARATRSGTTCADLADQVCREWHEANLAAMRLEAARQERIAYNVSCGMSLARAEACS